MDDEHQSSSGNNTSDIIDIIQVISCTCLILSGIAGSILSLKVFCSRKFKRCSTNTYIIMLNAVDAGYLVILLIDEVVPMFVRISQIDIPLNIVDQQMIICKTVSFLRHSLRCIVNWIIMTFTLERLIVAYNPLQHAFLSTSKFAYRICIMIVLTSTLISAYSLICSDLVPVKDSFESVCDISKDYLNIYYKMTLIYGCLIIVLPILITCISNVLIIRQLSMANKNLRSLQLQESTSEETFRNEVFQGVIKTQMENNRITWMLLLISSSFFILNVPNFCFWIINYFSMLKSKSMAKPSWTPSKLYTSIALIMHTSNFALHFPLFVISRRNFRKVLAEKMQCILCES
ncbi:hypothetical protein GJ496_005990 [Pomphorhynchus laevis]|nr:hypothetical protein GJ496_005990 [Pomphorhynchus laevis]